MQQSPMWHVWSLLEFLFTALWWNLAILLVLLTKTVIKQSLEIESLGARLDAENKKQKKR